MVIALYLPPDWRRHFMKHLNLGRTDIRVPDLCLGTMTFGNQTSEADAHRQMDMALDAGIDFLDTAEMYPVNPVRAETVGRSEEIVGNWIRKRGRTGAFTVATKVSGNNGGFIRDGRGFDGEVIPEAVEGSLKRLGVECIDLYQTHWPARGSYMFRQNWTYDPSGQNRAETMDHMGEVLEAMDGLVKAGKIKAWGLSNESAWGTAQWLRLAEESGLPRVATIQNEYSLLCRLYDTDLAELAVNEDVTLLSFSPLAAGFLTGKYQGGSVPEGSRMSLNPGMGGRVAERVWPAVDAYLDIATRHGLDPVHMALAWQRTRPFPISAIFGATTTDQLQRILDGKDVDLSDEVVKDIDAAHRAHPMPY